jgi:uncharacterized membrane protein YkvA (DUF1232 family)
MAGTLDIAILYPRIAQALFAILVAGAGEGWKEPLMAKDMISQIVSRMVEGFAADVGVVQVGVVDGRTPEAARRVLAAGLAYMAEPSDLISDDLAGIGIMDDAAILRLAARDAIAAGAIDEGLRRLGGEAEDLAYVFGDLVIKLEELLAFLPRPDANGRTPVDVIGDPDLRVALWRQISETLSVSGAHAKAIEDIDSSQFVRTMRSAMRRKLEGLDEVDCRMGWQRAVSAPENNGAAQGVLAP